MLLLLLPLLAFLFHLSLECGDLKLSILFLSIGLLWLLLLWLQLRLLLLLFLRMLPLHVITDVAFGVEGFGADAA